MLRILHRYVLWELVRNFATSFGALVAIVLVGAVYKPLRHGVGFGELAQFLPYLLPYLYAWVIPAAALASCVMTYGRLAADNELTAISASGVPLWHVCYPAFALALVLTLVAVPLNDWLIPHSRVVREREIRELVLKEPFRVGGLAGQFTTKIGPYKVYVEEVRGKHLRNVVVIAPKAATQGGANDKRSQRGGTRGEEGEISVYRAEQATYSISADGRSLEIELKDARCTIVTPGKRALRWFDLTAGEQKIPIPVEDIEDVNLERRSNLPTSELLRRIAVLRRSRAAGGAGRAARVVLAKLQTEVRLREALAFASLSLCLVGIPLGMVIRRHSRLASFAVAVVVFLVLYAMIAGGTGLAEDGRLPARLALWTPDALVGLGGVAMMAARFRR